MKKLCLARLKSLRMNSMVADNILHVPRIEEPECRSVKEQDSD